MNRLKIIWSLLFCVALSPVFGQISFFDGDFDAALAKAKTENKKVFVDFYTEWCGPCKLMATRVFTDEEVGKYFNEHFVCCKIDAEAEKELADAYQVDAYPNMVIMDASGKMLKRLKGAMAADRLLREAEIICGDALSFEQMYEKYKKNRKDYEVVQALLMEAPAYVTTQKDYDREKWTARIDVLFPEYVKNKGLKNMINAVDFYILTFYHSRIEKKDPIFDFVVEHYDDFVAAAGKEQVSRYVVGLNNAYIIQMCKKGDQAGYVKRVQQLSGDMAHAYGDLTFGTLTVKEAVSLLADATFYLHKGNEDEFFVKMDQYFAGVGDSLTVNDYTQPLEDLYRVSQGKMSAKAQHKSIGWMSQALKMEMPVQLRTRLLVMLGECYAGTGEREKAKQSYNQAFLMSAQLEDKAMMKQLQGIIQNKLQML